LAQSRVRLELAQNGSVAAVAVAVAAAVEAVAAAVAAAEFVATVGRPLMF
jgi:hypothetical protein